MWNVSAFGISEPSKIMKVSAFGTMGLCRIVHVSAFGNPEAYKMTNVSAFGNNRFSTRYSSQYFKKYIHIRRPPLAGGDQAAEPTVLALVLY